MTVKIDKGAVSGGINVIPMIDCVFFMLIFFLVVTKFEDAEREMSVVLPQASEAMPLTAKPKELFVNVDRDGHYFVSGQPLDEKRLLGVLEQASANNPGRQSAIIRADKRCVWEHVMVVMNLCNKAHIRDYKVTASEPTASTQ